MNCKRCNKPIGLEPWYGMCHECNGEYGDDLFDGGIPIAPEYAKYLRDKWGKYLDFDTNDGNSKSC